MIYTVTFNPAIDYLLHTDNLNLGQTNRSKYEQIFFGGKGINVSRVLSQLNIPNTALGFIAGFTGKELENSLQKMGINTDFIQLNSGITRINVKLKGMCETEINAQGPQIMQGDIDKLFSKLNKLKADDILVLAGSIPSTLPDNIYEEILKFISEKHIKTVVDATGKLLLNVLKYKPFLIKPNLFELEEICGEKLINDDKISNAAKALQQKGAQNVLVSLGEMGALLLDENGHIHRGKAFKITPVNTVGAGDSMVAGFIAGIKNGFDYALSLGIAAGCATAATADLATRSDIEKFISLD